MLTEYGAIGIVAGLRDATTSRDRNRAALLCGALIRLGSDHVTLPAVRASDAVADAITAFPGDVVVAQVALGALYHTWIAPVDTERLVSLTLDEMARHKTCLLLQQAGLRLLKVHAASGQQLLMAPVVLSTVAIAMRAFRDDDTIQHWSAEIICCLASIDPADLIRAHGRSTVRAMAKLASQLAANAPRPTTLVIAGEPWYRLVHTICRAVNA